MIKMIIFNKGMVKFMKNNYMKILKEMLNSRKKHKEIIELAGGSCVNCEPDIQALQTAIDEINKLQKETVWKSKIQNKINELEEERNKLDEINKSTRLYSPYDTYDFQINILNELLDE